MHDQFDLVIDAGNSRTKIGWVKEGRFIRSETTESLDRDMLDQWLRKRPAAIVIGTVGRPIAGLLQEIALEVPVLQVSGNTPLPIRNDYTTPGTLGADRIANAVGAWKIFPQRPVLAIDAGTCITYDLVDHDAFLGGAISPGKRLRARAMHEHSAALPLVDAGVPPAGPIGRSTQGALTSGVHFGLVSEISGMIERFRHQRSDMAVILTGGDGLEMARALKSGIFAHPLLTLEGLYAILVHVREAHGLHRSGWSDGAGAAG